MNRNLPLAYFLVFCKHSWFWLGIWVFYYLRFTDYAGIGLIETALIISMTAAEIPTGAIADLFGKRKTLFLSFLLQSLGAFWMAYTPDAWGLAAAVFIMGVGGSFYSGTLDALVYDTLKQQYKESRYDRAISLINAIQLVAPAVCSIIGGFLFTLNPRYPFIANGVFYSMGMLASLALVEPIIDTETFSWSNYIAQTKQGYKQLVKSAEIKTQTLLLLSVGVIVVIMDEMLNSFLGVEFGFQAEWIGIIWAAIFLIAAAATQLTPKLKQAYGVRQSMMSVGLVMAMSLLVSPVLGLIAGGLSLIIRASLQSIYSSLTSIAINSQTESKYRATTLSTFNMLKNLPYVLTAYLFGSFSDRYTAKGSAMVLGIILLTILFAQILQRKENHTYAPSR